MTLLGLRRPHTLLVFAVLLTLEAAACGGGADPADPVDAAVGWDVAGDGSDATTDLPTDATTVVPEAKGAFAFVILADLHITDEGELYQKSVAAVQWLNAHAAERNIQVVLVLGDIGYGEGVARSRDLLNQLSMPYVPIIGDNEFHHGDQELFDQVFSANDATVTQVLSNYQRVPAPTTDAGGTKYWFQSVAFDLGGVRFLGVDTGPRNDGKITGEQGDLHDFPGGTWPWFAQQIQNLGARPDESVVLFSHNPLHLFPGGLDVNEMAKVNALVGPVGNLVYGAFGGHYHFDWQDVQKDAGYETFVTASPWAGETVRLRLVTVTGQGDHFAYAHELVDVPFN
jgi:hypothetical protein